MGRKHGLKPISSMARNIQLMVVYPYWSRLSIQTNTTFRTPPFEHCAIKCIIKIVLGGGRILVLFNGGGTKVEFIHRLLHYFLLWLQYFPLHRGRKSTELRHIQHRPLSDFHLVVHTDMQLIMILSPPPLWNYPPSLNWIIKLDQNHACNVLLRYIPLLIIWYLLFSSRGSTPPVAPPSPYSLLPSSEEDSFFLRIGSFFEVFQAAALLAPLEIVADSTAPEYDPANIPEGKSPYSPTSSHSNSPSTVSSKGLISPSESYPFSYVNLLIFLSRGKVLT